MLPELTLDLASVEQEAYADEGGHGDVERDDDAGVGERDMLADPKEEVRVREAGDDARRDAEACRGVRDEADWALRSGPGRGLTDGAEVEERREDNDAPVAPGDVAAV